MPHPTTIAVDGPAGAGKSVISERLARVLGYVYVDSGAIYRAIALAAVQSGVDPTDGAAVADLAKTLVIEIVGPTIEDGRQYTVYVDGKDVTWQLFTREVDSMVSVVAAHPAVRTVALPLQRRMAQAKVVMAGRDIGTVVLPEAQLKIYLDASTEVRAHRRCEQLRQRLMPADYGAVLAEIRRRDELDTRRMAAPLRRAPDAVVVNTDELTVDEGVQRILNLIDRKDC